MDEIPKDILATAASMATEIAAEGTFVGLQKKVAAALFAERERCANVVEGIGSAGRDWALTSFMGSLRRDIAAAIRATPVSEREEG